MPDLQTALLDLLREVQGTDIKLIIGGGFDIYLRTDQVRRLDVQLLGAHIFSKQDNRFLP